MKKFNLEITVLSTGMVIMILELVGSRILAPYLGGSIFIWTSLIGIILGCLSIGYYIGGRLADKKASLKNLSLLLIISALLITLSVFIKDPFLNLLTSYITDVRLGSIIATLILFGPATIFLGMISPYCVKLKLDNLSHSGSTIGTLYAISTIGSILGTFLGGFFLISFFGNTKLLLLLATTLCLNSLFLFNKSFFKGKLLITAALITQVAILQFTPTNFAESKTLTIETKYNHIEIQDTESYKDNAPIRLLTMGQVSHSGIYLDKSKQNELLFDYLEFYDLAFHFNPDLKKALMLGGGTYTYPTYFLQQFPNANIDVVEIDPAMEDIAKEYFNLEASPRLKIIEEDARVFLNQNTYQYDAILGDAFKGFYAIPQQLTTVESMQKISDSLTSDGVFIANIISSLEGEKSKFLRAEYHTLKKVFPQVYIIRTYKDYDPEAPQNLMIVALKSKVEPSFRSLDKTTQKQLNNLWLSEPKNDIGILTDNFAPVDNYMLELL